MPRTGLHGKKTNPSCYLLERRSQGTAGNLDLQRKNRGVDQANSYEDFLVEKIDTLATNFDEGKADIRFPELKRVTFKRRTRGAGHVVVYEIDLGAQAVNILHVYHTAQDIDSHLEQERQ